jgi:hypothetical protein
VAALMMGTTVFAASYQKTITVTYNDLKIIVDGNEVVPKDANGNEVQPFSFEGTNYLPLRALANSFGYPNEDIEYDQETNTVYIGGKTTLGGSETQASVKLTELKISSASNDGNEHSKPEFIKDPFGNVYRDCIVMENNRWGYTHENYIEFFLDKQYKSLSLTIVCADQSSDKKEQVVTMTNDTKVIYTSAVMDYKTRPFEVSVDVSGQDYLRISTTGSGGSSDNSFYDVILANGILSK